MKKHVSKIPPCKRSGAKAQHSWDSLAARPKPCPFKSILKHALLFLVAFVPLALTAQFHRAEQDREISYWLLDPTTHQFHISHDFTVTRVGQKSVHSFVRRGSQVSPDAKMTDLDSGKQLKTYTVSGKEVNALGYYPQAT